MEKRKDQSVGKAWLKKEMRPYRGNIVFLAVLTVISAVLALSFSYLIKDLVNGAAAGNKRRILTFAGILLCIVFTKVVVQTLSSYLAEKYRAKITVGLRGRIFEKILRSDFSKVEKYHSGDLLTRMTSDVQEVAADSVSILPAVAGMIAQCIGAVSALLLLDPLFTAVFTFGGVVVGVVSAVFRKKVKKYHKEQTEADGASRAFMQEGIASLMTLKAYGAEEKSAEKCRSILNDYYGKRMKKNRFRVGMGAAFSFLSNAGTVFAVLWCSFRILRGDGADFGSVLSVVMLLGQLQQPFASFSAVLPVLYARAASGERLAETDALETEVKTEKGKGDGSVLKIQADGLCFTYGRNPVFENAAMQIEQGKIVCITGESGSGKSTLFKLLLSVYTPSAGGAYYIDGQGNKTLLSASTRELFAYVPQGNFLFSGTIGENLTFFADENVSEERIVAALKAACAEFVFELPAGLNTSLRERGGGLSEGQLQRLAVARALLSERPVLLLDEATSALDGETEKKVLENVRGMEGKTCLIVTHRPAALDIADEILIVKDGEIFRSEKGK